MELKTLNETEALANGIEERVRLGRKVVLSPKTALWVARLLQGAVSRQRRPEKKGLDLHADGSCVYHLDDKGNILEISAWAKNSQIAKAAFTALCEQYPDRSFEQRRRAWVEGSRPAPSPSQPL